MILYGQRIDFIKRLLCCWTIIPFLFDFQFLFLAFLCPRTMQNRWMTYNCEKIVYKTVERRLTSEQFIDQSRNESSPCVTKYWHDCNTMDSVCDRNCIVYSVKIDRLASSCLDFCHRYSKESMQYQSTHTHHLRCIKTSSGVVHIRFVARFNTNRKRLMHF